MRIKADLRALTDSQPVTSFTDKVFAGATSFVVATAVDFSTNDYVLIGSLASETTEIQQITVTGSTFTTSALQFDHPQDAVITKIGYNQIAFYYSATVTGVLTPLSGNIAIKPDSYYTYYDDIANTTGYGWFKFYNSTTGLYSVLSNPVPYADFDANSVKKMLDRFFMQISNRERKLLKDSDVIEWLNEAYAIARNKLNLVNRNYNVPTPFTLNLVAGTQEYALPTNFAKVRTLNKTDGTPVNECPLDDMPNYPNTFVPAGGTIEIKYYLRNNQIGVTPIPAANDTYFLYYQTFSPTLVSYIDFIDMPNNNFYCLLDYMLYRAAPITGGNAANFLQAFNNGLNNLVVSSHKQGDRKDTIEINWNSVV